MLLLTFCAECLFAVFCSCPFFLFLDTSPFLFVSFVRVHVHALFLHFSDYFPFEQATIKTIDPRFASRGLSRFRKIAHVGLIRVSSICQTGPIVAHEITILP